MLREKQLVARVSFRRNTLVIQVCSSFSPNQSLVGSVLIYKYYSCLSLSDYIILCNCLPLQAFGTKFNGLYNLVRKYKGAFAARHHQGGCRYILNVLDVSSSVFSLDLDYQILNILELNLGQKISQQLRQLFLSRRYYSF